MPNILRDTILNKKSIESILSSLIVLVFLILSGCESKYSESSPTKVVFDEKNAKERMAAKNESDQDILSLVNGIEKIVKVINLYSKSKNVKSNMRELTSLEILYDILKIMYMQIPWVIDSQSDGKFISYDVFLGSEKYLIPENCRKLNATFKKSKIALNQSSESKSSLLNPTEISETFESILNVNLNSCFSDKFNISSIVVKSHYNWINIELKSIKDQLNLECQIEQSSTSSHKTILCKNIIFKISDQLTIIFKSLKFDSENEPQVMVSIEAITNNSSSQGSEFIVFSNGTVLEK